MTIKEFNLLAQEEAIEALTKCCGSSNWVKNVIDQRPFKSKEAMLEVGQNVWDQATQEDALEAFNHHPKIGDLKSLTKKFATTKDWAGNEQAGVKAADQEVLQELAKGNMAYEMKYGYIFIVCATGKSAKEMLDLLMERLDNGTEEELKIAMAEQHKITIIRINKLIE